VQIQVILELTVDGLTKMTTMTKEERKEEQRNANNNKYIDRTLKQLTFTTQRFQLWVGPMRHIFYRPKLRTVMTVCDWDTFHNRKEARQ
jgi:hypothetical protein